MLWKYNYHCPHCAFQLTNNDQIRFKVETKDNKFTSINLNAAPGKYGYDAEDSLTLTQGDKLKFYCPSCGSDLQSKSHPQFVEVNLKVKEGIVFEVFFSPVYGEKITYVMMENKLVKYHDDFFGDIEA
ncbi:MAG: hypothetical protein ACJA1C_000623 [Crocinitomicaceae bacterium]|jgi:hypothetical protein